MYVYLDPGGIWIRRCFLPWGGLKVAVFIGKLEKNLVTREIVRAEVSGRQKF